MGVIERIDKQRIEKKLPDRLELESDIKIRDSELNGKWGIAKINKNGKRRVPKKILEISTDYSWKIDSVSNFILHLKN